MLMPRLVRLTGEFGGRFLLVMLNTDRVEQLARSHGVVSLPTVKVYRHGKVVETLHGAESESVLRDFIRKQLADTTDTLLLNALRTHAQGDTAQRRAPRRRGGACRSTETRAPARSRQAAGTAGPLRAADDLLQALPAEVREELPELRKLSAMCPSCALRVKHRRLQNWSRPSPQIRQPGGALQLSAVQLLRMTTMPPCHNCWRSPNATGNFRHDAGRAGLHACSNCWVTRMNAWSDTARCCRRPCIEAKDGIVMAKRILPAIRDFCADTGGRLGQTQRL